MEVSPQNAVAKAQYEGKTYQFCSLDCKKKFDQNPAKFGKQAKQSTA
jgi:YHS domain-containing protein